MSKFRVKIDKNACQGFGACVELCPQFFQLSDVNGKSTIEGAIKVTKENARALQLLKNMHAMHFSISLTSLVFDSTSIPPSIVL